MQATTPRDIRDGIREFLEKRFGIEAQRRGAKDALREIFCNMLGFSPADEDLLVTHGYDFRDSLREILEEVEIIANTEDPDPFSIIYAGARKTTKAIRQDIVKDLIRITGSIDIQFANFILILGSNERWQIISPLYIPQTDRSLLRIYTVEQGARYRTLAAALAKLRLEKPHPPAIEIKTRIDEAMRVRPLTEDFFEDYKRIHGRLVESVCELYGAALDRSFSSYEGIVPEKILAKRAAKGFAHVLLNRLMFIYFLQKKGWLGRRDLIRWLAEVHAERGGELYRDYLRPLLLDVMCRPREERDLSGLPDDVREVFEKIPYFNGGLFSRFVEEGVDVDEIVESLDDDLLQQTIYNFLEEYNFTITEESPYEVEVAVDPTMLGHIYESLIAEQERGASGIFYTPRAEVDFMCRLGVIGHLRRSTALDDNEIISFVISSRRPGRGLDRLRSALSEMKVVDPACGSGAFLLGMFHVLTELREILGETINSDIKREIIHRNLYGVDIKEWAVRVAEMRLWLALIEEESHPGDEPILPNLHTNIAIGESVAPPVVGTGEKAVQLRADIRNKMRTVVIARELNDELERFVAEKERLFSGRGRVDDLEGRLEEVKRDLLQKLLSMGNGAIDEQSTLSCGGSPGIRRRDSPEARKLRDVLAALRSGEEIRLPFIWEVDFAEVFREGGFDVVVSNPPYVRQEQIYPQWLDKDEFLALPSARQRDMKDEYKKSLVGSSQDVIRLFLGGDASINLSRQSDMYVYFFIHSTNILKKGGTLVYITSNSWLDVGYGERLQEFMLRCASLRCVVDSSYRSFEQADVNTVITVLERKEIPATVDEHPVAFALLKRPFGRGGESSPGEDCVKILFEPPDDVRDVSLYGARVLTHTDEKMRVRYMSEMDLVTLGGGEIGKLDREHSIVSYKGAKWGGLLIRAPEIFYTILKKGEGKLVRLGDIAEVRRGFTTGANEFFYVEDITDSIPDAELERVVNRREIKGVEEVKEKGLRVIKPSKFKKNDKDYLLFLVEGEYLKPVIKSPREIKSIVVKEEDLKYRVLMCHEPESNLKGSFVLDYIRWGEEQGYQRRPTCASRRWWWDLGVRRLSNIVWVKSVDKEHKQSYIEFNALVDQRLYEIAYEAGEILASLLNSSLFLLSKETQGRANLGDGVLDTAVYEANDILSLHPQSLTSYQKEAMSSVFKQIKMREITSIFTELGFDPARPIREQEPNPLPDRKALDDIVFDALGLTEEERREVYWAVAELVQQRLKKARTFEGKVGAR